MKEICLTAALFVVITIFLFCRFNSRQQPRPYDVAVEDVKTGEFIYGHQQGPNIWAKDKEGKSVQFVLLEGGRLRKSREGEADQLLSVTYANTYKGIRP